MRFAARDCQGTRKQSQLVCNISKAAAAMLFYNRHLFPHAREDVPRGERERARYELKRQ